MPPPKTPKVWPPVAVLTLLTQNGSSVVVSTAGTVPGKIGQGRSRTTSTLAGWTIYWGDNQQESGNGAPPTQLSHVYDASFTTVFIRLVVIDMNTLSAQATLTVTLQATTIPAAPTGVAAVTASSASVTVTWNAVNLATSYSIERSTNNVDFNPVGSVTITNPSPPLSFTDTGLTANTTYYYRVQAFNGTVGGPYSATASATTFGAPAAPSLLSATAVSSSEIDLSWTDNASNEDGFTIERSTDGLVFAQIASVAAGVTAYANTGLTAATLYYYRVRAFNSFGVSTYSNTDSDTTDDTVPTAPTSLTATAISPSQINLAWVNTATNATSIRIERKIGAGAFGTLDTVAATTTTYQDTGLSASTLYTYRLFAVNATGDSPASPSAAATTPAGTAPAAPSGLTTTVISATQINLAWTDNSSDETGFKIERDGVQIATVGAGVTTYSDSGLTPATLYAYRVRAYNAVGNSSYSNTSSATTNDTVPSAPTGLTAAAISSSAINLAWTNTATNATSIRIERRIGTGSFATLATVSAVTTSYSDTGLAGSTTYTYRLFAVNAVGDSPASLSASATTNPSITIPNAPSNLVSNTISASAITIAWTDNSTNESGFRIERALGAGSFVEIATVGQNVTTFADSGLNQSQQYRYRVRAYNSAGNSAYSNILTVTTSLAVPAAPTSVSATAVSQTSVSITWVAPVASTTNGAPAAQVVQRRTGAASFATIQTVSDVATSYLDTTAVANTTYDYRVLATNGAGTSAPSNTASVTTPPAPSPPAAPTNLTANAVSASAINLAWTDNSTNEDGFIIARALGSSGSFVDIATVSPGVVAFSDTGLNQSQLYRYQVRAYNGAGSSATTNTAQATTNLAVPAAPTNCAAVATSPTSVTVTWVPPAASTTNGAPTAIAVQRRISPAAFATIGTVGGTATSFTDTTAVASTTYDYRTIASNTAGSSAASNTASVTTPAPPPSPPNAPTGLTATAISSTQINLAWTDASADESGFKIERSTDNLTFVQIATVATNVVAYSDTSVSPATQYYYRIRSYNQNGNSAYTSVATATTPVTPVPAAPTGLTVGTVTQTSIALSWTDNATNEQGYSLERAISGGGFTVLITLVAGTTTYLDQNLNAATQYSYRVRAFNNTGNSAYSNTVSATTQAAPPTPPTAPANLTASLSGPTQVTLGWMDTSGNETGFVVERRVGSNAYAVIASVAQNVVTYIDTTVIQGTTYDYRVKAINAAGSSAYSNTATITIPSNPVPGAVLSQADLTYIGCFRMPSGIDTGFAYGGLAARVVNGQLRFFVSGNTVTGAASGMLSGQSTTVFTLRTGEGAWFAVGQKVNVVRVANGQNIPESRTITNITGDQVTITPPLPAVPVANDYIYRDQAYWTYEIADPRSYDTNYLTAPRAALVTAWPDIFNGHRVTWRSGALVAPMQYLYQAGLYWHEGNQLLYWGYYDAYSRGDQDWCIGATRLDNPSTGASTSFGPWRPTMTDGDGAVWTGPMRGSYLAAGPDGSMATFGAATQAILFPWGPELYSGGTWPTSATPSGVNANNISLADRYLEHYYMGSGLLTANHFDANGGVVGVIRSFKHPTTPAHPYIWEGLQSPVEYGNPALTGGICTWTDVHRLLGAIWLESPTKRGAIFAASITGSLDANSADAAAAHTWYQNAFNPVCRHGFGPPNTPQITGPVTTAAFPAFIIYDPNDLRAVKAGTKVDYTTVPTSWIDLQATYNIRTAPPTVVGANRNVNGFYFDSTRNYLFCLSHQCDDSTPGILSALIHVFSVNLGTVTPPVTYGARTTIADIQAARGPQPSLVPSGSFVTIQPGQSIQQAVNNAAAGTTFYLRAGIHSLTASIVPKSGDIFWGEYGAILDGSTWSTTDDTQAAIRSSDQNYSNVTIRNLVIRNMPKCGVHAVNYSAADTDPARNWLVEYCEVHHCGDFALNLGNFGCRILHCLIHDNPRGQWAIFRNLTSIFPLQCEVGYNEVYACGSAGDPKAINIQAPIWWHHNYIHDVPRVAIWNDGGGAGSIIEDNILERCIIGIQWEIATNGIIRYNTVRNMSDDAIFVSTSGNNEVHNNRLEDNFRGVDLFVDCSRVGNNEPYPWFHDLRNNNIHDNYTRVPVSPANSYASLMTTFGCPSGSVTSTPYDTNAAANNFSHNIYAVPTLNGIWWAWVSNKTWTTWQALPQDVTSVLQQGS